MSNFADDLNAWVGRQAQSSVEEQILAAYAEEHPAPEGQEWFVAGQQRESDGIAYRFDLRAAPE
jgi:hypothetical protein